MTAFAVEAAPTPSQLESAAVGQKATTFEASHEGGMKPLVIGVVGLAAVVGLLMCALMTIKILRRARGNARGPHDRVSRMGNACQRTKHTRIRSHEDGFERGLKSSHLPSAVAEEDDELDDEILGDDTESAFASRTDPRVPPSGSAVGERAQRVAHTARAVDESTQGCELPATYPNAAESDETELLKRVAALLSDQPLSTRGAGGALE